MDLYPKIKGIKMVTSIIMTLIAIGIGIYLIVSDNLIAGILNFAFNKRDEERKQYRLLSRIIGASIVIFSLLSTSFAYIPKQNTGHLVKKILGTPLKGGKIIATNGELGRQADFLPEGLTVKFLLNIIYDVQIVPNIIIPKGYAGVIIAQDGEPLHGYVSRPWKDIVKDKSINNIEEKMLDAKFFLSHHGEKGVQLDVLKTGEHKINQYLFKVKMVKALQVPAGSVAVVTSRVGKEFISPEASTGNDSLATPIVPVGYIGVWDKPLMPNAYYQEANPFAYQITMFNTKIQTWVYAGGFTEREIIVSLSPDGKIEQTKNNIEHLVPKSAVDKAVSVKSKDGWVIYIEARMQVQSEPKYAPRIVASVGTLQNMEDRVITPIFRSVLRNEAEHREAVEFLNARSEIEKTVNAEIIEEAKKAGVSVKDLRITHISIPPALLVPKKRTQLASQMKSTYIQEQLSYAEQIKANKTKAIADQQEILVKAQISKESANELKEMKRLQGVGERLYLEELAKGQKAQVDVIGVDKTYELKVMDKIGQMLKDNPNLSNTPTVFSVGANSNGGVSDSSASILALQQLRKSIGIVSKTDKEETAKEK